MGRGGRPGKKEPGAVRAAVKAWQSWYSPRELGWRPS
jgi:hypothetical protein